MVIERKEENAQSNEGTGPTAQTTSANVSVAPLEIDAQLAEEIEQQEQEAEEGDEAEMCTYARRVGDGSGHHPYANPRSHLRNNSESPYAYRNTSNSEFLSLYPNPYLFNPHNHLSNSRNNCAHL